MLTRLTITFALCLSLLQTQARAQCDPVPAVESLINPGSVLLLGEIHETFQGPAALQSVVCAALQSGIDIAVGLEITVSEEAAALRFMDSAGEPDDISAAIAGSFCQNEYQDGRASEAMLGLLQFLRDNQTGQIHLFFIDNAGAPQGRDRFMST